MTVTQVKFVIVGGAILIISGVICVWIGASIYFRAADQIKTGVRNYYAKERELIASRRGEYLGDYFVPFMTEPLGKRIGQENFERIVLIETIPDKESHNVDHKEAANRQEEPVRR